MSHKSYRAIAKEQHFKQTQSSYAKKEIPRLVLPRMMFGCVFNFMEDFQ